MSLPLGGIYNSLTFTTFKPTYHDILIFDYSDKINVTFQKAGTDNPIKVGMTDNATLNPMYLYPAGTEWKVIYPINVATMALAYYTDSFKQLILTKGSVWLDQLTIPFNNGKTYGNILVTRGKTFNPLQHIYTFVTDGNPQYPHTMKFWTDIGTDPSAFAADISNGIDLRFYSTVPEWYISDGLTKIKSAVLGTSIQPPVQILPGNKYPTDLFIDIKNSPINVEILSLAATGEPLVTLQKINSDGLIKMATNKTDLNTYYVIIKPDGITVLDHLLATDVLFVYIDESFDQFLHDERSYFGSIDKNSHVLGDTDIYNTVFVTKGIKNTKNTFTKKFTNSNEFSKTINFSDVSSYVNNINDYDVNFYIDKPEWLTPTLQTAIKDAYTLATLTINPDNVIGNNVDINYTTNLVYAKSWIDESKEYIQTTVNEINNEINQQKIMKDKLQNTDDSLYNELQDFVNQQSESINLQLNNIVQLRQNLDQLYLDNQQLLTNNSKLYTFLGSAGCIDLTNKIFSLRNIVYDSVKFINEKNVNIINPVIHKVDMTKL